MAVHLAVAAEPFDCATCDRFVQDGDLIAEVDVYLLCESCAEKLPGFVPLSPVERDHLIRHGVPASQGHTHTCDEHGHAVRHAADECRSSNYCPEGCLF
jgi:hypothetical protein